MSFRRQQLVLSKTNRQSWRGISVIEIVMIVAMLGFMTTAMAPFLSDTFRTRELSSQTVLAVDALSEAQFSAMSGKGGRRFGVHFEADQFVFFRGATYVPGDTDNDVFSLPGDVSITDISIAGGGNDIHFENPRGLPTETGTITFAAEDETKVVSVNAAGMIDVN